MRTFGEHRAWLSSGGSSVAAGAPWNPSGSRRVAAGLATCDPARPWPGRRSLSSLGARAVSAVTATIGTRAYSTRPLGSFADRNHVDVSPCPAHERRACGGCCCDAGASGAGELIDIRAAGPSDGQGAVSARPNSGVRCGRSYGPRSPIVARSEPCHIELCVLEIPRASSDFG
jgi:hypothetical protein